MQPLVVYNYKQDMMGIWLGPYVLRYTETDEVVWPYYISYEFGAMAWHAHEFADNWIIIGSFT